MENAFETRTVNLETDKSHSEKPALVHSEQKKLKGFTPAVRRLSGVWPEGGGDGYRCDFEGGGCPGEGVAPEDEPGDQTSGRRTLFAFGAGRRYL